MKNNNNHTPKQATVIFFFSFLNVYMDIPKIKSVFKSVVKPCFFKKKIIFFILNYIFIVFESF
jgi:hypothetical protein